MTTEKLYQTTVIFERHNKTTIRKMITKRNQRNIVQTTITMYYRPVNERTEERNEAKIPSSDENEGIHFLLSHMLSCIEMQFTI